MTAKDLLLSQLGTSKFLLETFTKDFSDEDARFQPFPGGNTLNWILVHLAAAEDWVVSSVTGKPKQISESLHKAYGGGEKECRADDGMTRAEAWKVFNAQRVRTEDFVRSLPEARYSEKTAAGGPQFPTVGHLMSLVGFHPFWHFGQLTVNRRMLKKPSGFGQ